MPDNNTKYYKVTIQTNNGIIKNSTYYTMSKYYSLKEIEMQIKNAISSLNLSRFSTVYNIDITEVTKDDVLKLIPINKVYKTLKKSDREILRLAQRERFEREGIRFAWISRINKVLRIIDAMCYSDEPY